VPRSDWNAAPFRLKRCPVQIRNCAPFSQNFADAERVDVKILGEKQMDVTNGHVVVQLDDPEWVVWANDRHAVVVSARATGIHPVSGK
jgi:hypothetical protein